MIRENIVIETTEEGLPCFEPNTSAWVAIEIHKGDSDDDTTQIEICGRAAGLRRLGEILIAVASCKSYHEHLDASEVSPLLIRGVATELVISNVDERPHSEPDPNRVVPDWAKA